MVYFNLSDIRDSMDRRQEQLDIDAYLAGLGSEVDDDSEQICSHCGEPCLELIVIGEYGVYCSLGCQVEGDRFMSSRS
jgi:hypothetical protein